MLTQSPTKLLLNTYIRLVNCKCFNKDTGPDLRNLKLGKKKKRVGLKIKLERDYQNPQYTKNNTYFPPSKVYAKVQFIVYFFEQIQVFLQVFSHSLLIIKLEENRRYYNFLPTDEEYEIHKK